MTCVVGMAREGRVYIGADSAGLSGWHLTTRADAKVFAAGEFVYGFAGSFRLGQILQYAFKAPAFDGAVMPYMVRKFIPAVRKAMAKEIDNKAQSESPGEFLVGFRGRLFEVCIDFQVGENTSGIAAIGCGREPAMGALYALGKVVPTMPPRGALMHALRAAEAFSGGVRGPFKIVAGADW